MGETTTQLLENKILLTSLLCASSSLLLYYLINNRKRNYVRVATVSKLFIYPVKTLCGVEVDHITVDTVSSYGKYKDRQFVLVDEQNRHIPILSAPTLVKIKLSLHNQNEIWFDVEGFTTLKIAIKENIRDCDIITIPLPENSIKGIDCGPEASEWFSRYLSKPNVRLIQHVPAFELRPARSRGYFSRTIEKKYPIIYQNRASVYVLSENALKNLNEKISDETKRLSFRTFRPNIVVSDCEAHEEDNWSYVNISDVHFKVLLPCGRCVMTTVNVNTGVVGTEPLETLRKYRLAKDKVTKERFGQSPLFGIYFGPENVGTIAVNDPILAVRK